jgi:hypothetical protein
MAVLIIAAAWLVIGNAMQPKRATAMMVLSFDILIWSLLKGAKT